MLHKVAHLSSVHPRYSTRIFIKQCRSLSDHYHVSYVVADGKEDEINSDIQICDVGKPHHRMGRLTATSKLILKKALKIDADLYHLHDPELLLIANRLQKHGKKVIFDAHEDFPKQILSKPYLSRFQKKILSWTARKYESHICSRINGVISATPDIRQKFLNINQNSVDIKNYPILNELYSGDNKWGQKKKQVCYVGGLSKARGIDEIIRGCKKYGCKLKLAGMFISKNYERSVTENLCDRVELLGYLNREEVKSLYEESMAGLVTLHPISNYVTSLPVKMFEYMSAGIPVIASNFPLWKEVIEGNKCGICVNPENPEEIASAIEYIVDNPEEARRMGQNGRRAVELKYNWEGEAIKLLCFYQKILHGSHY